jgi:dCMP deaminase
MRQGWDEYFMGIAQQAATRSTCSRLKVGAVLVSDRRILATGYNGSVHGLPHCDDVGCQMEDGHCVRTVHAEVNALIQAGPLSAGADLYVTASPCWACFKCVANAAVKRIVFGKFYSDARTLETARLCGIECVELF